MQNTNLPWRIYKTTDKYFINYGKKGYRFCEIGLMLDNLSEHQIEALSNLLRGNDCFISQPTGSGKSAVYQ
jgi:superfamily II DNA or RNA helicase